LRKKLTQEAPHLVEEWMSEKNDRPIEEITAGSKYEAWWKCRACDNKWKARVSIRSRGSGCPQCSGRQNISLLENSPHLAKEWVLEKNTRPIEEISTGSQYKAWWQCRTCDNQWEVRVSHRVKGSGCPKCAGKHRISLIEEAPHLVEEWMSEKNVRPIEEITSGSGYKAWWQCRACDNQWEATVGNRVKGNGCLPCSQLIRKNRPYIVDKYKNLIEEWVSEKNSRPIEEITAGSNYRAWWKCRACDQQWESRVYERTKGSGCPRCAGRHDIPLLEQSPHLEKEWIPEKNDRKINEITAGSNYKAWWQCKTCDNQWQAVVAQREKGTDCPHCAGRTGIFLIVNETLLAKEWISEKNDKPLDEIMSGSNYKAWWQCKTCDNQWQAIVQSRVKGTGCPKCRLEKKKIAQPKFPSNIIE